MRFDTASHLLRPSFSSKRVAAWMSTRDGGVGSGAFASFNLRPGVGDDEAVVAENRRRWTAALGVRPVRIDQVHGTDVVRLVGADTEFALPAGLRADASWTTQVGLACEIQVADCLPVLLAHRAGRAVGGAHAGWRGLAGGVLENTVRAVSAAAGCGPDELEAWLGPCIGPEAFEVGADVVQAFGTDRSGTGDGGLSACFRATAVPGKWMANLQGLARIRLCRAGVRAIHGNDGTPDWCTVTQASRYFSFRRDHGVCGRMAAAICLRDI